MSTTSESLRGLVEALYARTEEGRVDWNLSEDGATVWAALSNYRIELVEEQSDNYDTDVRVTVYNSKGSQVDTFSDVYFRGMSPVNVPSPSYFTMMATLLEMARRQASGADAAIQELLVYLKGKPVRDGPASRSLADDLDDDVPF